MEPGSASTIMGYAGICSPNVQNNSDDYFHAISIEEMANYMNHMDFVAISFYTFFKDLHTAVEFQGVFDFLHSRINKPIAFVETSHIAEDLKYLCFCKYFVHRDFRKTE